MGQAGLAPGGVEAAEVLVLVEGVERVAQACDHRALGEGRPGDARGLGRDLTDRFRTQAHGSPLCRMADRIRRRYRPLVEVPPAVRFRALGPQSLRAITGPKVST